MMLEITRGFAPTLETVTVTGVLVTATPCLPNTGKAGDAEAAAVVTPVPLSETISGVLGSFVAIVSWPVLFPDAVGVKFTLIVQDAPLAIGDPLHVLDGKPKSPETLIFEICRGAAPTLFKTTDRVLLVIPTPCLPKDSDGEETEAAAVVTPVPDKFTTSGLVGSSLMIVSVPVLTPAAVGVNVAVIVHVAELVIGSAVQVLKGKSKSPVV